MTWLGLGLIGVLAMIGGAAVGIWLGWLLPNHHRDASTREAITLATGLIITVTSLTLSLLLYSTKNSFDAAQVNTSAYAASIIVLDRSLSAYGPDAEPARRLLHDYTDRVLRSTWPEEFGASRDIAPIESHELGQELVRLHDEIRRFHPRTPYQEQLVAESRANMNLLIVRRFALLENVRRSIPPLLMAGAVTWLAIIFMSLGLHVPRNGVVISILGICALVAASCITLMDEMDGAFDGLIKVSSAPIRDALANIGTRGDTGGAPEVVR